MNQPNKSRKLRVDARVRVEIDSQPALLTGQGDQLQLALERRETLAALAGSPPAGLGRVADALANSGLTLTVVEEQKPLLIVGHDASSVVSGWLIGSRHIVPASLWALFRLLRGFITARTNG